MGLYLDGPRPCARQEYQDSEYYLPPRYIAIPTMINKPITANVMETASTVLQDEDERLLRFSREAAGVTPPGAADESSAHSE